MIVHYEDKNNKAKGILRIYREHYMMGFTLTLILRMVLIRSKIPYGSHMT